MTLLLLACRLPVPEGPAPDFPDGEDYVAAELVYQELQRGASFFVLDARPPADYDLEHIQGAYSVPFYEVEDHEPSFPQEVWMITYCACPHSESGIVAEYMRERGHPAAVLDEGFLYWLEQGWPTEGGP